MEIEELRDNLEDEFEESKQEMIIVKEQLDIKRLAAQNSEADTPNQERNL